MVFAIDIVAPLYFLFKVNNFKSYRGYKKIGPLKPFMAVIGPNGAGKTTFLDVITGKTAPTEGDVVFKG